jgi:hypothetical protein
VLPRICTQTERWHADMLRTRFRGIEYWYYLRRAPTSPLLDRGRLAASTFVEQRGGRSYRRQQHINKTVRRLGGAALVGPISITPGGITFARKPASCAGDETATYGFRRPAAPWRSFVAEGTAVEGAVLDRAIWQYS